MADDISSDEREEIVESASDDDGSPLKATGLIGEDGTDERVSSTVRTTSVSTSIEKSGEDVHENGELEHSGEEESGDEEDEESEEESEDETSSEESNSEDSEEFER